MRLFLVMPTGLRAGYEKFFWTSPLGIETLAAHARDYADVTLADMRRRRGGVEAHASWLVAQAPDMIGVTMNSAPHTKYSVALARAVKRLNGDLCVIVGGQQATFLSEELLATGDIDAVVRGEGELTLSEILATGGFAGVAGVSWRDGDRIRHEADRPLIDDLDTVRQPARDLLPDRSRYRVGAYRVEGLETSRGCPHRCSFCSVRNFHRGRWRPKSVERVMAEIDDLLERYPEEKVIYFADDSFATDMRRVEKLCRAIAERRSNAYFWCQARGDALLAHPEVVEWMGKARFAAVLMGIETPIPRLMAEARKGATIQQIMDAIDLLHAHDIGVWGTFVLGLPGETPAETATSAAFIPTAGADVVQITVATPIPGSELYERAKDEGSLITHDWDAFDFGSPTMLGQLPKPAMDALLHKAYLRSYMSGRFFRSLLSRRTNLNRLRRTAFRVFGRWIWYLAVEGVVGLLKRPFTRRPSCAGPSLRAEEA
ncbi:MAG: B12-binding domain-containing radical SAM protein [Planctomycetota bacterium]